MAVTPSRWWSCAGCSKRWALKDVETFIASGNVIFAAPRGDTAVLQRKLEAHLHKSLGYEVKVFIRTAPEIAAIAQYKPFKEAQLRSAQALNVAFLSPRRSMPARRRRCSRCGPTSTSSM